LISSAKLKNYNIISETHFPVKSSAKFKNLIKLMNKLTNAFEKIIINKGTGAGGKNTNLFGKKFEELTNYESLIGDWNKTLLTKGTKLKNHYFLFKKINNNDFVYVSQKAFVSFFEIIYNRTLFRNPDEAIIITDINDNMTIKILEKKEQHVEGSVETKLWSAVALKREYQLMLPDCKIEYAFCLNSFFKNKFKINSTKWKILGQILNENDIKIFYGEDPDYFEQVNEWYKKISD